MPRNKIIYLITLIFLLTSCGGGWDSVKRGLTGEKKLSTDEFLVKKKDPLILPPDFESLPTPSDRREGIEEVSSFEKTLTKSVENVSESKSSAEQSILKKIPKTSSTQGTSIASDSTEQSILREIKKK
jgi:flagellar hook-basal body complex protein FliE